MNVPNVLSLVRIILSPVFIYLFLTGDIAYQRLSLLVFFIAVLTDWYDGWYARKYKNITKTGVFLDPFADKILTTTAFALFYIKNIMPLWMFVIIAFRDIVITIVRSYDEYNGLTLRTSKIAKTKTFIQMTYIFMLLILLIYPTYDTKGITIDNITNFLNSDINYVLMFFVTAITLYTGISYFFEKGYYKKNEID